MATIKLIKQIHLLIYDCIVVEEILTLCTI